MSDRALLQALFATTVLCSGMMSPAFAQLAPPPPVRETIDSNGVDLFDRTLHLNAPALTIGGGSTQGLSYYRWSRGAGWSDNVVGTLNQSGNRMTVSIGESSDGFTVSGTTFTSTEGNASTLTLSGTVYTYATSDGTVAHFDNTKAGISPFYASYGRITDITAPSGEKLFYGYQSAQYCSASKPGSSEDICIAHAYAYRLLSIRSSYGYAMNFTYQEELGPDPDEVNPNLTPWGTVAGTSAVNLAATGGTVPSQSFGTVTNSGSTYYQVTDTMSRVTKYRYGGAGFILGITRPGSTTEDLTVTYVGGTSEVASLTSVAGTTIYSSSDASGVRTVTVTDPLSNVTNYTFDIATRRMNSAVNALGQTTAMQYDASGRLTRTTMPEGNYALLTYDGRGNVTESRQVAKSGSGVADIIATADFPTGCTNTATCNQPTSTTDARGNTTSYTYDATHGGVLTVTAPAPSTSAPRPQTRYSYLSVQAYFDKGSGIVASGEPVYRIATVSQCQTATTCVGTADEVKTTLSYGPQATGTGNNLLPVSTTTASGDGTLSASSAYAYDPIGNLTSVDGPLAGTDDTMTYRYDADREKVGSISADPDGAGTLKRRATRFTYDDKGRVTLAEVGTVNGLTNANWAAFATAQAVATSYDAIDRKTVEQVKSGTTVYAVTQYSYDHHRLQCSAIRMNSAAWGSLPSDACTAQTTGSAGPDRITKLTYDSIDRATKAQTAYGTADQSDDTIGTYTANGQLETLTDAEGNKTSYDYDGVDRLVKTRYPSPTQGSGTSSTTDYEELIYDAASNVRSRRLRGFAAQASQHIDHSYDALNRVTFKNLPGTQPDVTYSYDLLGRLTGASQTGNAVTFGYDALGRNISQSGANGTVGYQYDAAGRRTRMTWPDAFYVTYDYDVTGSMTAIRETGATSGTGVLATYAYDSLGRRTGITRGNNASTSYAFDAVSRLSSLSQNLSGTTNDLTLGFDYNPASQIAGTTRSNDVYAWTGQVDVDRDYSVNGLNQLTTAGTTALGYDARGNLTSSGSDAYGYTTENLLKTGPAGATLGYDPLLRLYETSATGTPVTRFQYDGLDLIAEYDASGTVLRRYVHGPGADEPLVWYEGADTALRRWLIADERGSVIAVTNVNAVVLNNGINRYDEYGIPGATNLGRFGYTGQTWLPELGMNYYKARMYSPTLGRFLQTDPIGYGDGINWYNYVGGDPVNSRDPSGLDPGNPYACPVDTTYLNGGCVPEDPIIINGGSCSAGYIVNGGCRSQYEIRGIYGSEPAPGTGAGLTPLPQTGPAPGTGVPQKMELTYKPVDCGAAQAEAGQVDLAITTGSFIAVVGAYASFGSFYNRATGTRGLFYGLGGGFGLDLGFSEFVGSVNSLSAFAGNGRALNVGVGGGASFIYDAKGNYLGNVKGVADRGASATVGRTKLFRCEALR